MLGLFVRRVKVNSSKSSGRHFGDPTPNSCPHSLPHAPLHSCRLSFEMFLQSFHPKQKQQEGKAKDKMGAGTRPKKNQ